MSTEEDIAKLRRLSNICSGTLSCMLKEIVSLIPSVVAWIPVTTSGSAVCRYGPRGIRQYEVRYQVGDLGNLVHEITHVAVNEAYGLDFINYTNVTAKDVPARKLDHLGRCTNEAERQTKQMDHGKNGEVMATLTTLRQWAEASLELTATQRSEISNKLLYGMMNPQKESDTVMNQVLVWLFEWGYPVKGFTTKKPVVNALYEELSKEVKKAHENRQTAKIMTLVRISARLRRRAMGYED